KRVEVKLGHGGTLDPMATGVLIVGAGKGTKELPNFLSCTKTYETVVLFGCATDTYDRVGKVVSKAPYEHITREKVEAALKQFRGHILQRPSIYSALKQKGKKLYEYAREGIEPPYEIAKRPVEVSDLRIMEWYAPNTHDYDWPSEEAGDAAKFAVSMVNKAGATAGGKASQKGAESLKRKEAELEGKTEDEPSSKLQKGEEGDAVTAAAQPEVKEEVKLEPEAEAKPSAAEAALRSSSPPAVKLSLTVSSGFYVRSFAHDLGLALGSNGMMSELVRARQGDFDLDPENIIEYKDLEAGEEVWGPKLKRLLQAYADMSAKRFEESQRERTRTFNPALSPRSKNAPRVSRSPSQAQRPPSLLQWSPRRSPSPSRENQGEDATSS
ncbi:hypothetical protein KEM55_007839, partial [Ascosphaera atra]